MSQDIKKTFGVKSHISIGGDDGGGGGGWEEKVRKERKDILKAGQSRGGILVLMV